MPLVSSQARFREGWRRNIRSRESWERLPPIEYHAGDAVVYVGWNGELRFRSQHFKVSNALHKLPVAIRPRTGTTNRYDLYFKHHRFGTINLDQPR